MNSVIQKMSVVIFLCLTAIVGCAKHNTTIPSAAMVSPEPQKILVARVNDAPIYMDSLVKMMNRLPDKDSTGKTEPLAEHRSKALDRLILQELAYQQAKSRGVSIGNDKIDMAVRNLKENLGGEKEYEAYLSKQNLKESDIRAQVERALTIELMYAQEVLAKVSVPEDDVKREYEKEKSRYILPEKISATEVLILDTESPQKTGKAVLSKIKADPDKNPWNLVLDGSFTVQNIDIKQKKDAKLYDAAKKLKPGELSGVLKTESGTRIIKLISFSPEKQLAYDDIKSDLESKFKTEAQEKRTREWEQELKQTARIDILNAPL